MSGNQKQQTSHQNQSMVKTRKTEPKAVRNIDPEQMLSAPETLRSEDVLAAQQQFGNQVVQRALDKKGHDRGVTDNQGNLNEDLTKQIQARRGGGSPLPDSIQKDASKKLGRKFNDVRIHTDETADKLSRSVSARAFTIGKDIFFKGGVFSPTSSAGRETLIHELTHVVQQSSGKTSSDGKLKLGAPDTAMEKEAAHLGKKHATQQSAALPVAGAVQRVLESDEAARAMGAKAYTQGADVHFKQGENNPNSNGKSLIPHELSHVVQQRGLYGEAQAQPDLSPAIQRQGMEEEELLQGQPDANAAIQRESGEEEELQMQKDPSGSLIQRTMEEDLQKELEKRKAKASAIPAAPALPAPPAQIKAPLTLKEQIEKTKGKKASDLKAGSMLGLDRKGLANAKKGPDLKGKAVIDPVPVDKEKTKAQKEEKKKGATEAKKAAALSKANAQEDSKAYTGSRIKATLPGKAAVSAVGKDAKAKDSVEAKADPGKEEKKEESTSSKVGGMFKKGLGFLGSKIKGIAQQKLKDAKEHYTGKKEEEGKEEKKEEAKSAGVTVNVNSGGGSGGGGGGMAETISDLYQENKKLKAENAELKKKKEEVPVV